MIDNKTLREIRNIVGNECEDKFNKNGKYTFYVFTDIMDLFKVFEAINKLGFGIINLKVFNSNSSGNNGMVSFQLD